MGATCAKNKESTIFSEQLVLKIRKAQFFSEQLVLKIRKAQYFRNNLWLPCKHNILGTTCAKIRKAQYFVNNFCQKLGKDNIFVTTCDHLVQQPRGCRGEGGKRRQTDLEKKITFIGEIKESLCRWTMTVRLHSWHFSQKYRTFFEIWKKYFT